MNNISINEWMVKNKLSKNGFAANHIFNGLQLSKEPRFWRRAWLVMCYREWRNSRVYNNNPDCFDAALRGARPTKLPQGNGGERQE